MNMAVRDVDSLPSASDLAWYEKASPELLMQEFAGPATDGPDAKAEAQDWVTLRGHLETRLTMMRAWRFSWIQHWALIAQYLNPRRSLWLAEGGVDQPVPNSMVRGLPINQAILDPTATYAMQVCSAGMMSGLMSPSRPWFKLKPGIKGFVPDRPAVLWFEAVENLIYSVMAHSNFYDAAAQMMEDLVAYGTAPMIIYEDERDIIRCYNPVVGEYYIGVGPSFRPESLYRQFVLTVIQIVEMFGLDNCPYEVRHKWEQKGSNLETEYIVAHSLEPNFAVQPAGVKKPVGHVKGNYTFREVYWLWGMTTDHPLSMRGFKDIPFIAPRWYVTSNDPYGRSPAMTALGDIMQLQQETKRKAELLEKMVRPPLNAPVELKNQPSSILPGMINYVSDVSKGMKPVYDVNPMALAGISQDLKDIQERVKTGFFNNLFLMLEQQTKDMTAYEVAQRQQEKLQVLGPVIERFQNEGAMPAIQRFYAILRRKQLLPPLPRSLIGIPISIEFVSMLALAQRAVATAGIERLLAVQGKMAAVNPAVLDVLDDDEILNEYGDQLGVTKKVFNSPEKLAQIRDQRAMQQRQQAQEAQLNQGATETGPALAMAAKNLSDTDTGGGMNALQMMLGSGGGGAGAPAQ